MHLFYIHQLYIVYFFTTTEFILGHFCKLVFFQNTNNIKLK